MKNLRMYAVVVFCLSLCFYMIGCGGAASSSGGGASTGAGGKLSDPYIGGAIVFNDINGSGTWDSNEMIATTDATGGGFSFSSAPGVGTTIEMMTMGTHLGASYEGVPMRLTVNSSGTFNLTPLTTITSGQLTPSEIVYLIRRYSLIAITTADVYSDPMAGLDSLTTMSTVDALAKIRASIAVYSLLKILEDAGTWNSNLNLATIESAASAQLTSMGTAVRNGLSDTLVDTINASMAAYSGGGYTPPAITVDQVANSAFIITKYIVDKKLAESPTYEAYNMSNSTIEAYGQSLGMRYYILQHYDDGFYTPGGWVYPMRIAIGSGITDGFGNTITTAEVLPSGFVGYNINFGTGAIERL